MSSSPSRHFILFAHEVCAIFQGTRVELRPEEFGAVHRIPRAFTRTLNSGNTIFKAAHRDRKQDCTSSAPLPLPRPATGCTGRAANWLRPQAEESCRV
jgi:hypothetical protein